MDAIPNILVFEFTVPKSGLTSSLGKTKVMAAKKRVCTRLILFY